MIEYEKGHGSGSAAVALLMHVYFVGNISSSISLRGKEQQGWIQPNFLISKAKHKRTLIIA